MNPPNKLEEAIIQGVKAAQREYIKMSGGWWLSHGSESFITSMVAHQACKLGGFFVFPEASPRKITKEANERPKRGRPSRIQGKRFDILKLSRSVSTTGSRS